MKIAKLLTWHWGSLEDREWMFADTVLLTGESGSGKSTLLDAIQTVLTAAHQHLVQFNIGQDESTQSRRGGKEPRTLAAYALGQQADGVFLRPRSTSYAGIVFDASERAGESAMPLTALVGVEAFEDGKRAVLAGAPLFFIVRQALSFDSIARRDGDALDRKPIPLKELYLQLQHRLQVGPETVQRFADKGGYLQHLYGALMGKTAVGEADANRAAKSIVRAMAYKELGNVNDLVRDEILEPHDFSRDLDKMRELMRSMAALKAEAERLVLNLKRLELARESAQDVLDETRRFVVTRIAHALRTRDDAVGELESVRRRMREQDKRQAEAQARLASLIAQEEQLRDQLRQIQAWLDTSEEAKAARDKAALDNEIRQQANQFRLHWATVRQTAAGIGGLMAKLAQLLDLNLASVPALAAAVDALRPAARRLVAAWPDMAAAYAGEAQLDAELPAYDLESFDADMALLELGLRGGDDSVQAAVVQALGETGGRLSALKDETAQRDAELRLLQGGRPHGPPDAHQAVDLIKAELPEAYPYLLAQLVEPRPDSIWQNAIEGYMGGDRFAVIVEAGWEARCARLVKRRFPVRSPKVVQGRKAMEDTEGGRLEDRAIMHELRCDHPVAQAFLMAQYGRVRKVESEEELARTPQGLMQTGLGSRGYGMFACHLPDQDLAFGESARQRRRKWCEDELVRLQRETTEAESLRQSLNAVARLFSSAAIVPMAPTLLAVLESQILHTHAAQAMAALDLSSVEEQLRKKDELDGRIADTRQRYDALMKEVGAGDKELVDLRRREADLSERLPDLEKDCLNAGVWAIRYSATVPELATAPQLHAEAGALAADAAVSLDALRQRIQSLKDKLSPMLRTLATDVSVYLSGARDDTERFVWTDPPRDFERMEELLPPVFATYRAITQQIERQRGNGLAENTRSLRDAEVRFNHVFTSSFCFKVRDDVRQGASTLQRLNRHLQDIQFGADNFKLEWDWVPRMHKVFDFFEAVEAAVEDLEKEQSSIFDSELLSDEQRATAGEIRTLLLANDQGASERALKELADYRNYRRYDIVRSNAVGQTKLSTWGTGSGGELETPFYVVRSAVLAHALGHFGRDRREAPALRLMLSDEAFSKMDESRSRSVLRFLSEDLGLQLVVAMPTSKSGAVKPEFDKEFTFSKVLARRDGRELFVSEAQEKTLHRAALDGLWRAHAEKAREAARSAYLAERATDTGLADG